MNKGVAIRKSLPIQCYVVPASRAVPTLEEDVKSGLCDPPRTLPPKYFYDERGSQLFDRICDTPEYYPTRTEDALLAADAEDIIRLAQPDHIVELGSGTARKTRHLFNAASAIGHRVSYWPFDVCEPLLVSVAESLRQEYPAMAVNPLVGDYHAGLDGLPPIEGRRLFVFLGGTLGNFTESESVEFLTELRGLMRDGDTLLLGVDRVKDHDVLNAAYNDAAGVTAEFNTNVLRVLNRELDANFDVDAFRHRAQFVAERGQVEMYLVCDVPQTVRFGALDLEIQFNAGERLRTEISRKFTPQTLTSLLTSAGLSVVHHAEPTNRYFSLVVAQPV
ncbi:MAG: L-histidine N(alpha)-methyltransferase [Pseudomonadota bacterium]|nr:L-histidine N(alpha)-methyltransferase [Pseudomonadota bacterium]